MQPQASLVLQLGIALLSLAVIAGVACAIARYSGRAHATVFSLGAGVWLATTAALALAGFFSDLDAAPPRFLLLMLPALSLPLAIAFSRVGTALLQAPLALIVGSQAFRFPLELILHRAATEGVMPPQMSFSGYNFDIVTGLTALVVAFLAARGHAPRWLIVAWNAVGSALLLNILTIAVASLPQLRAFGDDPRRLNTWIAYFPFVWLPAALVSAAVLGHALLWRRLASHAMGGRAFA